MARRFVSIALPALNEEAYIAAAVSSVLPSTDDFDFEVLVMDGGSRDRTCELVRQMARDNPRIRLVHNEKRLQSAAINLAARIAHPDSTIILRADCHATYPAGFVERCVRQMQETGAHSVVVPMRTVGRQCFQRAVAATQNSKLGNGGASHRASGQSGWVEHGHHAAFDRTFFLSLGGYDESFSHNEDAELDRRIVTAGGHIWMDGGNVVDYFPRSTVAGLARQYVNHGKGRARTVRKHKVPLKLRQMVPLVILAGCAGGLILAPLFLGFLLVPLSYAAMCCGWGAVAALRRRDRCLAAMGIAAMAMHLGWAVGFLRGLFLAPVPAPLQAGDEQPAMTKN